MTPGVRSQMEAKRAGSSSEPSWVTVRKLLCPVGLEFLHQLDRGDDMIFL